MKSKPPPISSELRGRSSSRRRSQEAEEPSLVYQMGSIPPSKETVSSSEPAIYQQFFRRLWVAMLFFCLAFSALAYRAYDLQVMRSESFRKMILESQYVTLRLSAPRGTIYDRNMTSMAMSAEVDSLAINPRLFRKIHDKSTRKRLAQKLADILGISLGEIQQKLEEDKFFTWLKRDVGLVEMEAIKRLAAEKKKEAQQREKLRQQELRLREHEGKKKRKRNKKVESKKLLTLEDTLYVRQEQKRVYPRGAIAAHILGHTDIDGRGLAGVELTFDRFLRGKPQELRLQQDTKGRHILVLPKRLPSEGLHGASLVLTIDNTIQYYTEKHLADAVQKFEAKRGIAIVMDPNNGDVLALAISPTFDPNKFHETSPHVRGNWAVTAPYEPGSTLKVLTVAVARELKVVRLDETIDDEKGRMRVGRKLIRDDHPKRRPLTPKETIQYSSNIVSAKLAFRVGKEKLYEYFRRFGLGERTGIGIPGESKGLFYPPKKWPRVQLANIGFGQGVAVTPLQLTAAVSVIANGGIFYRPRLYRSIYSKDGRSIREFPVEGVRRVISEGTAREVRDMMTAVVTSGTGKAAAVPGYTAAGKTGTAQKAVPGQGYGKGRIGSFVGFVPAENPRLAILVLLDEPKKAKYGGDVAAPAWSKIALSSLQHLGYASSQDMSAFKDRRADLFGKDTTSDPVEGGTNHVPSVKHEPGAEDKGTKIQGIQVPTQKSLKSLETQSTQGTLSLQKSKLEEWTGSRPRKMPRFVGMGWEEAHQKAQRWKIKIHGLGTQGRGRVRFQSPSSGKPLSSEHDVTLIFRD